MNGNSFDSKLETLIDQVGRLTEGLIEIKATVERVATTTEPQAEMAQQQSERIDRLTETTGRQAVVAERQAASVARLTQIVEGMLQR